MVENAILLRQYVTEKDEQAFGELVARYMDLVYSAALRQVGGDTALAQDVAQKVFTDLARKAHSLSADVRLGGWLYRRSCFVARTAWRTQNRRQAREQAALAMDELSRPSQTEEDWQQIAPVLDDAMNCLNPTDRDVLVLRFFERQPLRVIGTAIGASEDAVRMRVGRALESLRRLLAKRGVTSTTSALAIFLADQAITAAPAGIAAGISGAALAGAAVKAWGISTFLFQLMTMTKLKIGIAGLVIATGVTLFLIIQHQHNAQRGTSEGAQSRVVIPEPLPGNYEISTLRPAGRDTATNIAQSILYAVFHNAPDTYQGLALNPPPESDPMYSKS